MICTLLEKRDNSREIIFEKQDCVPNFWIKSWSYVDLPSEKIQEIQQVNYSKVQEILKTL